MKNIRQSTPGIRHPAKIHAESMGCSMSEEEGRLFPKIA
jgi:hypothetical protein